MSSNRAICLDRSDQLTLLFGNCSQRTEGLATTNNNVHVALRYGDGTDWKAASDPRSKRLCRVLERASEGVRSTLWRIVVEFEVEVVSNVSFAFSQSSPAPNHHAARLCSSAASVYFL